jgi:hypothetical protein
MHSRLGCKSYFRGGLFHKNRSYTQNARSSAQQHQAWLVPLDHLDQPGLDKVDFRRRPAGDRALPVPRPSAALFDQTLATGPTSRT